MTVTMDSLSKANNPLPLQAGSMSDMSPVLAVNHVSNRGTRNTIALTNLTHRRTALGISLTNVFHSFGRQLDSFVGYFAGLRSRDMFPCLVVNDSGDGIYTDAVFLSERDKSGVAGSVACANLDYLLLGQPGQWSYFRMFAHAIGVAVCQSGGINVRPMLFAALDSLGVSMRAISITRSLSTLRHHICSVISLCSKKQMLRPNAGRVIAMVADPQSLGDGVVVKFPREAVGVVREASLLDHAIATTGASCCPNPTVGSLLNVRPEVTNMVRDILGTHGKPPIQVCRAGPGLLQQVRGFIAPIIAQGAC